MAATIRVQLRGGDGAGLVTRFQNLGEDVYRELGRLGSVDLDEIDSCSDAFHVREVRKRDLGEVTRLLKRLIRRHMFDDSIELVRDD